MPMRVMASVMKPTSVCLMALKPISAQSLRNSSQPLKSISTLPSAVMLLIFGPWMVRVLQPWARMSASSRRN